MARSVSSSVLRFARPQSAGVRGLLFALAALLCLSRPVAAANVTWLTTGTNAWNNTAFWSGGALPTSSDVAIFSSNNGSTNPQLNTSYSLLGLVFTNTGSTGLTAQTTQTRVLSLGSSGITISGSSGAVTIGDPTLTNNLQVTLLTSQTWTNNSSNLFTVSGTIVPTNVSGTYTLTVDGAGNTAFTNRVLNNTGILALVKAAGYRDYETGAHISRVGLYAELIAQGLGLAPAQQAVLREAAAMHDIGKVGIPDHILCKPGRLDDAEMAIMRTHPQIGHDLLKDSSSALLQAGATIALTHHEKFDGSGYPHGLTGEAIPLLGRIVAVADVLDALTSQRPYKKPWPLEDAGQYLREQSGLHFDPACVHALLAAWPRVRDIGERLADTPAQPAASL